MKKILFIVIISFIISSCKEEYLSVPLDDFDLTGFSPANGYTGDTLTIYGKTFIANGLDSVFFNAKDLHKTLRIIKIYDDSVKVIIPKLLVNDYQIFLKYKSKSTLSRQAFKLKNDFKIYNLSIEKGFFNQTVIIFGSRFIKSGVKELSLNNNKVTIEKITNDTIVFKIPNLAIGEYNLLIRGEEYDQVYGNKFEIINRTLSYIERCFLRSNFIKFNFNNFDSKYRLTSDYVHYPSSSHYDTVYNVYNKEFVSPEFALSSVYTNFENEIVGIPYGSNGSFTEFSINTIKNTLDLSVYNKYGNIENGMQRISEIKFKIKEMDHIILNDSSIVLSLNGSKIKEKISLFEISSTIGFYKAPTSYSSNGYKFFDLLNTSENSTFIVTVYRK